MFACCYLLAKTLPTSEYFSLLPESMGAVNLDSKFFTLYSPAMLELFNEFLLKLFSGDCRALN